MSHRGTLVRLSPPPQGHPSGLPPHGRTAVGVLVVAFFGVVGGALAASCAGSDSVPETATSGAGGATSSATGTSTSSSMSTSSSTSSATASGGSGGSGVSSGGSGGMSSGGAGGVGGETGGSSGSAGAPKDGGPDGNDGGCVPKPEVCNGLDDDCDGVKDNGDPGGGGSCTASAFGECAKGTLHCVNGALKCMPGTPQPEVCDGLDNNCDGFVDEGNPGGGVQCPTGLLGICSTGVTACSLGKVICQPGVTPGQVPEACNGLDDNCDGLVDNNIAQVGQACTDSTQKGICQFGTYSCPTQAPFQLTCNHPLPGTQQEVCDGLDNDCNGIVDDPSLVSGLPCTTGLPGVCTQGTTVCSNGSVSCNPITPPSTEICDAKDNDCNGQTDEMNPTPACQSQNPSAQFVQAWACTSGVCAIQTCSAGHADINNAPGDGCECATDSYSNACSTAGSVSVPLGGSATMTGKIETATGSDWLTFSYTVPPVGQAYHPKVQLTDSASGQYSMDVRMDCATFVSCGDGGGGSKITVWEQTYGPQYVPGAGCCSDSTPRIATIRVRVYRTNGDPPTCAAYTVTATNT